VGHTEGILTQKPAGVQKLVDSLTHGLQTRSFFRFNT